MPIVTDTAAASCITDHAFVPRGEWWTTCGHPVEFVVNGMTKLTRWPCGLAEAAHATTTVRREITWDMIEDDPD